MPYNNKKIFLSRLGNSEKFKYKIEKKRIEQSFYNKKVKKKIINEKENKIGDFFKIYFLSLFGIILMYYNITSILELFKEEYLQIDKLFWEMGYLTIPVFMLSYLVKKIFSTNAKVLKHYNILINYSVVLLFIAIIIEIKPLKYFNEIITYNDLIGVKIKHKSINLISTKYNKHLVITSYNYPDFYFKIRNLNQFDYENLIDNSKKDELINIKITKQDMNKKLTKNKDLDFMDKHFNYKEVLIYELNKKTIKFTQGKNSIIHLILVLFFTGILTTSSIIIIFNKNILD
ncbi:hypothetical protein [Tenacibaculum finnmarkense]|uniref:hypothetical protein n=1 Tax=Tenacibaculum finnmarkense TaxID=2781243 RepID=UPI001E3879AB|nr:hypothetical protein [Tenacibaculum finnmarkense]MCD8413696.1 hypothetical protein [Tenacibaculum finnmarkense genomovar ulcerans]